VIARPVTGHDQDLHQHDNQIVEYANSKVEKTGRKKRKGDSEKGLLSIKSISHLIYSKSLKDLSKIKIIFWPFHKFKVLEYKAEIGHLIESLIN